MARPSTYTDEIAETICEEIAAGAALYKLCERDDLPAERTVYQWLEGKGAPAEFAQMYVRARERQQDREVDHCVIIADEATDANLARLQIDARKWRAAKLAPKKYGERIDHNVDGEIRFIARLPEPVSSIDDWQERYRLPKPADA